MANGIFKHRVHLYRLRDTARLLRLTGHRHFFTEHFVVGALGLAIGHRLPQLCELGLGIANLGAHDQGNLDLDAAGDACDSDADGDNVPDAVDNCRFAANGGQLDSDGDGIEDRNDACVNVAGLAEFNGCPDTDGDGIEDAKDACPKRAGSAEFDGCPDTDGDGVADPQDGCPRAAGVKALGGCPDRDGDGIADKDDECPDDAGTAVKGGCPEMTMEIVAELNESARLVLFLRGKSDLSIDAKATLDDIASVLKKYATTYLEISGHT